ncbi:MULTISPECIES: bifunctional polysaccharide deacetylase/glycosyltransferase family 2 protein [unclassified Streptomyces]|uniref:bifunctional polysaccharide deacetylase/glycosyltransferase family 2 protein n=1 Tax=unclassified Streptomyces TaxID=2593676 RepID=UPI002474BE0E|nr:MULTISPECIES: bifunctional polysaccharide deacetylase/glycosyltransferase family 2 protein [unclassified Streptomyces]MDH6452110.1 cellulose synthase/poly-beta-1,6-N-acetylglucosamine synthase-like glycosyltransferase/peptidoglycan/xylan/chitin deacetylase (PgdA/CDA1 family) [Streptomyces sp. SAI-119]MDH6497337.1 cellulose synthase/poly-beta-1,6-N-acetylglucosamine synthase-like glycosyltransferase/peptidoglycan/xylan/chitin deacetylase (PgdA/CDA1 family) [Streptomyces sp. SAI-149]
MTTTTPSRGRRRAPTRMKRAAGKAAALQKPRVILALLLLLGLTSVMLLDGYLRAEVGGDQRVRDGASSSKVPDTILNGGPIISFRGGQATTTSVPARTIALTFDDGPNPTYTPQVLKILEKYDVPATFFVVGSMVSRYPGIVKDMVDQGNEVGIHTFTHVDLSYQSDARVRREMTQTQLALAGAAGITTTLFRAPYSSETDAIDNYSWPVYEKLGEEGYTSVFVDTDSDDWKKPGVSKIVKWATPSGTSGASVLMHDAGGDREQTIEALPKYIEKMRAKGYTFTTISGVIEAQNTGAQLPGGDRNASQNGNQNADRDGAARLQAAHREATGATLYEGKALVGAVAVAEYAVPTLSVGLAVVGVAVMGRFGMMLILARRHYRQRNRRRFGWGPAVTRPVSVIVPAYNEKECIANTLESLARSTHPIEVVIVDDGSSDGTSEIARAAAEQLGMTNVRVVRQENAGKPAALNNGVRSAGHDIVVMMDGDTVFEPDTVRQLVQPFANEEVGAVAGNAKVGNRNTIIGAWQHIEYVMGFNLDRRMYDLLRCMPTIPGAIGAFRREAVLQVGGMSEDTLAEDTDITIAMHRAGWRVVYQEHARAWTEAPGSLKQLWSQRYRWSYGTMQALWKHRKSLTDKGPSGRFGRVGMPLVVIFQIVTPVFAPLIDVFTAYSMIFVDFQAALYAWLAVLGVQLVCAAYAFKLDREKYRYLLMMPLQQLAYRQMMYLVLIHSCITALTGGRLRWQKLKRTGEVGTPAGVGR